MVGFEIDFLPVGEGERSGDAIALRYGQDGVYTIHVVDGGDQAAGEGLVAHIRNYYGNPTTIDHVVLTHADDDHSSGLREVIKAFRVGAISMNRPWLYAGQIINLFRDTRFTVDGLTRRLRDDFPILVEIEQMAIARRIPIYEAFQGARIGAFTVLSPSRFRYLALIPHFSRTPDPRPNPNADALLAPRSTLGSLLCRDSGIGGAIAEAFRSGAEWIAESWGRETLQEQVETSPSNESSVVQFVNVEGRKILLTGDAGTVSLQEAADFADPCGAGIPGLWFMQVPHHGSRHNVSPSALDRWLGPPIIEGQTRDSFAFVSVSEQDDKRPRRKVTNAFIRRGTKTYATKGGAKRHGFNMPTRGWGPATPLEFSNRVEA